MKTMELKKGLYWNGVLDPGLRVFDIVMRTEFGTTYNSYILKGSEKTALFETSKFKFLDDYIASVESIVPIKDIDYIIVDHTEPDHAGSIEKIIEINPNIKIVATPTAITFLRHIVNRDFYSVPVKENDTLSLGDKTLQFMVLPNLHWPDTMYTYAVEDKVLFTCDSFGSHYSHEGILRSTITDNEGYMRATKYYFDNIIGPFKNPYMLKALDRIKDLDIDMICTGHGPVLDSHIDELVETYKCWCSPAPAREKKLVVIPYVSAYGYTRQLADEIARGIGDSGDVDVEIYDMVEADAASVLGRIGEADGILFGTPTIVGEALAPIWNLTTSMFAPVHKGKLASAFGSYGWSGEGVPHIIERLKQLKLKVIDGFRVRFKPSKNEMLDAYEFGYNFGCVLFNKENDRKTEPAAGKRKLVKCLVCGEIFDASLDTCPVCGVGRENFVEYNDDIPEFTKDTEETFLILGGGAAAFNAAKEIRARNNTCKITMLSGELLLPYNRPMLTKSMLADFTGNQLLIEPQGWYDEHRIEVLLGKCVTAIDPQKKAVTCTDGTYSYDKLIYALGSVNFVPPIAGANRPNVITMRGVYDAKAVKNILPSVKSAVVIGGGVLGLESAWELNKSGVKVTVLESAMQLMPRQLDEGASDVLEGLMEACGIGLVLGAKICEINDSGVSLADGSVFEAQLVIISTGVRAVTDIAAAAGIKVNRSIVVDSSMRTNIDDIFACGDCAEYLGVNFALWSQAVEMGKVAGACAAGDNAAYKQINGALNFNGLNTSLFALGDNGKQADKKYRTVELKDNQRGIYEKYYFLNNRLSGVILIGDTSRMAELTKAVEEKASLNEVIKL